MSERSFHLTGYTCETHNNPADFFLDVINGDATAVAHSKDGCDGRALFCVNHVTMTAEESHVSWFLLLILVIMKSWSTFLTKSPHKKINEWIRPSKQIRFFKSQQTYCLKSDVMQSLVRSLKITAEMWIPSICGWFWKGLFTPDPRGAQHSLHSCAFRVKVSGIKVLGIFKIHVKKAKFHWQEGKTLNFFTALCHQQHNTKLSITLVLLETAFVWLESCVFS